MEFAHMNPETNEFGKLSIIFKNKDNERQSLHFSIYSITIHDHVGVSFIFFWILFRVI